VLGDPGSGKTTLAIQSAYENAMYNVPAYVLMAETDVVDAALSVLAQTMKETPAHVLSRIQYDPTQRKNEIIDKYIDTPWKEHIPEGLPLYLADLQGCGVDHALSVVASIRNAYVVVDHAFAFVHQGVQDDNVKSWDRYLYFYKKLAALAVRNNLVVVVMNQYTKTGMEDWRSPHAGYGGVSSHAIACSQINLHNDPERNFSHYTCVQFVITKVKARLVTELNDFNREVSVDPVGKEGAYYINTRWREISSTVTP